MARKKHIKHSRQSPQAVYSLSTVREILQQAHPNVSWILRKDGKTDLERLGISVDQALRIIRNLRPKDFDIQSMPTGNSTSPPADVYKTQVKNANSDLLPLYIKFFVRDSTQLVIISFHD